MAANSTDTAAGADAFADAAAADTKDIPIDSSEDMDINQAIVETLTECFELLKVARENPEKFFGTRGPLMIRTNVGSLNTMMRSMLVIVSNLKDKLQSSTVEMTEKLRKEYSNVSEANPNVSEMNITLIDKLATSDTAARADAEVLNPLREMLALEPLEPLEQDELPFNIDELTAQDVMILQRMFLI